MSKINMNHLIGKRIQLISCKDQYTKLKSGSQGIIDYIDDAGTVFVNWDEGSKLGLIPGIDHWKYLS